MHSHFNTHKTNAVPADLDCYGIPGFPVTHFSQSFSEILCYYAEKFYLVANQQNIISYTSTIHKVIKLLQRTFEEHCILPIYVP